MPEQIIYPLNVPDVTGNDQTTAETTLSADRIDFSYAASVNSDTVPFGSVVSQSPIGGGVVNLGEFVTLTLSLGRAGDPVPPIPVALPMTVIAPPADLAGILLQAEVTTARNLVVSFFGSFIESQYEQLLNRLEVELVDHFMVTGWLNAGTILAMYQAPSWDKQGQVLTARVAFLQNLVNNPPAMPEGNHEGFGDSGWTTILQNYQTALYAAQISLVEHIMDLPGGTSAATILNTMTGFQSFPFEYVFSSVGHTEFE